MYVEHIQYIIRYHSSVYLWTTFAVDEIYCVIHSYVSFTLASYDCTAYTKFINNHQSFLFSLPEYAKQPEISRYNVGGTYIPPVVSN